HHHGRRRLFEVLALERARAVDEPDIALRVRGEARHVADLPLRRYLGPILLHFESRQRPRRLGARSGAEQILARQSHRNAGRKQDCDTEVLTFHGLSSVGLELGIAWELFVEIASSIPRMQANCRRAQCWARFLRGPGWAESIPLPSLPRLRGR